MDEEQQLRGALRQDSYVRERTAWVKVQRELTELKLAQARAELAPVPPIALAIGAVAAAVKQAVLAVPSAVCAGCVGRTAEEINHAIYEALRRSLEPFDEVHIDRLIRAACEGASEAISAGAEAAATVYGERVGRRRKAVKQGNKRKSRGVAH